MIATLPSKKQLLRGCRTLASVRDVMKADLLPIARKRKNYLGNVGGPIAGAAALGAGLGALIGHTDKYIFGFVVTSADSDGGSPDDTLNVVLSSPLMA